MDPSVDVRCACAAEVRFARVLAGPAAYEVHLRCSGDLRALRALGHHEMGCVVVQRSGSVTGWSYRSDDLGIWG